MVTISLLCRIAYFSYYEQMLHALVFGMGLMLHSFLLLAYFWQKFSKPAKLFISVSHWTQCVRRWFIRWGIGKNREGAEMTSYSLSLKRLNLGCFLLVPLRGNVMNGAV